MSVIVILLFDNLIRVKINYIYKLKNILFKKYQKKPFKSKRNKKIGANK